MRFSHVWTRLGALGTQGNTEGVGYYPFPVICGFLIDNTGSLVLTTQKLQKLAGGIYFCCAYWKMQKVLGYLEN